MKKQLAVLFFVIALLASVTARPAQQERVTLKRVALKGYLIDRATLEEVLKPRTPPGGDSTNGDLPELLNPYEAAKALTKESLLAPDAVRGGYAIVHGAEQKAVLRHFDREGNKLVRTLIAASKQTSGIRAEVTGTVAEGGLKVESIKESR